VTRKHADPPWRAVSGLEESGGLGDLTILPPNLTILPPKEYRDRYWVHAHGRLGPDGYDLKRITVTDRKTFVVLTFNTGGGQASARLPVDLAPKALARVWGDATYLAAWARKRGRPTPTGAKAAGNRSLVAGRVRGR
jgi:hypothetical protein